ncbi:hypothetical protein V8B97DRAFT_257075 [Scleroderma yunnanense]
MCLSDYFSFGSLAIDSLTCRVQGYPCELVDRPDVCGCLYMHLHCRLPGRPIWPTICLPVAVVGYIILLVSRDVQLSYFAVYLAAW